MLTVHRGFGILDLTEDNPEDFCRGISLTEGSKFHSLEPNSLSTESSKEV